MLLNSLSPQNSEIGRVTPIYRWETNTQENSETLLRIMERLPGESINQKKRRIYMFDAIQLN